MRKGIIGLLGLVLGCVLIMAAAAGRNRVYTVSEVLTSLAQAPGAWEGRTALVWGMPLQLIPRCTHAQWCPTGLYKPYTSRPGPILLLEPGPADALIVRLRALPVVNAIVPRPQRLRWNTPAVYRLLFRAVPHTVCDAKPCINALLVDAT